MTHYDGIRRIDDAAVAAALALAQQQPQANANIAQLPSLAPPQATDLVAVFRPGVGYTGSVPVGQLPTSNQQVPTLGYISVKDYGATGNGSTDDTAAFISAIAAATAASPTAIFIPPGTYLISSTIYIQASIVLFGLGKQSGFSTRILAANLGFDIFYGLNASSIALYGFDIHYAATTGSGGIALHWQGCQDVQIRDMDIVGFWNGMLVDSSGDVIYAGGTLVAADVPSGGGRYGVMCAAISPGNANQTACSSVGVTNRGTNNQTVDAFVLTLGYNTLTLINCGAESCLHAAWTKNDGGNTPNFFVALNFTAEGCGYGFQFDDGGVTQIQGGLITTSGWGVVVGPDFSASFPGVPITIVGLDFTSTAGAYVIQGNATVAITGGHLNSISGAGAPFNIPSDAINLSSTSTSARVTMDGVQMNGVFNGVHVTSTWAGTFVGTGLLIQFVNVGVQWDSGWTGNCIITGGEVSNASTNTFIDSAGTGGLPANAHLGSSVIGVVGINPIGPNAPPVSVPVSGTVYVNKTGFPLQVILSANAAGATTVSIASRGPYTVPQSSTTVWNFPPNGTFEVTYADAPTWDWAPAG